MAWNHHTSWKTDKTQEERSLLTLLSFSGTQKDLFCSVVFLWVDSTAKRGRCRLRLFHQVLPVSKSWLFVLYFPSHRLRTSSRLSQTRPRSASGVFISIRLQQSGHWMAPARCALTIGLWQERKKRKTLNQQEPPEIPSHHGNQQGAPCAPYDRLSTRDVPVHLQLHAEPLPVWLVGQQPSVWSIWGRPS